MKELNEKIKELKKKLTGNLLADAEIKDEIHKLEIKRDGVEVSCSMDEGCDSCGA